MNPAQYTSSYSMRVHSRVDVRIGAATGSVCWFVLIAQVIGSKECKYERNACQPSHVRSNTSTTTTTPTTISMFTEIKLFPCAHTHYTHTHFGYGALEYMCKRMLVASGIPIERRKTATWTSKRLHQSFAAKLLFTFAVEQYDEASVCIVHCIVLITNN